MGLSLDFCLVPEMQMENTGAPGLGAAGQGSRPVPESLLCVPYALLAPVGLSGRGNKLGLCACLASQG